MARQSPVGQGLVIIEASRSHSDTHTHTYTYTHTYTHTHTRWDFSGRKDLYVTTHTTEKTDVHALSGIRTRSPSKRAAADPRLDVCTVRITSGDLIL
jgi:hypothetical protein